MARQLFDRFILQHYLYTYIPTHIKLNFRPALLSKQETANFLSTTQMQNNAPLKMGSPYVYASDLPLLLAVGTTNPFNWPIRCLIETSRSLKLGRQVLIDGTTSTLHFHTELSMRTSSFITLSLVIGKGSASLGFHERIHAWPSGNSQNFRRVQKGWEARYLTQHLLEQGWGETWEWQQVCSLHYS